MAVSFARWTKMGIASAARVPRKGAVAEHTRSGCAGSGAPQSPKSPNTDRRTSHGTRSGPVCTVGLRLGCGPADQRAAVRWPIMPTTFDLARETGF
jgi:hypothetical protein